MLGFTIGLRALSAAQQAMEVIGQNVSNASTPGYTRRLAQFMASDPLIVGRFQLGTGVLVTDVRRIGDDLLEARLRETHQMLGQLEASGSLLTSIEGYFQEPNESGLGAGLDALWSSFSQLTQSPTDSTSRDGLVQSASTLATGFRQVTAQVGSVGDDARRSVLAAVDQVNALTSQLASLNTRVLRATAYGGEPSDLLDERNRVQLELSDWVDAQSIQRGDGSVDVLVDGRLLVSGDRAMKLETLMPGDGTVTVRLAATKEAVDVRGGRVKGYLDLARNTVPTRLQELDRIARELIYQVNKLHTTGVSSLGPYTSLVAAVAVDTGNGEHAVDAPLADLNLPFEIKDGRLAVNVENLETGAVERHFIDIDPHALSMTSLASRIDDVPHLTASLDSVGRLRVAADAGYGFDFSPRLDPNPDDADSFGSSTATLSTASGPFALNVGDTLTIDVDGSGPQTVTFQAADFSDITHATADEVAAVINANLSGLHATASDGRLVIQSNTSGTGGSLQVLASSNAALFSPGASDTGNDIAVDVTFTGAAADGREGHFTVVARGDGTVGLTPGLQVEVFDESGTRVGIFDVGSGYTPGDAIEILPGITMKLAAGNLEQTNGDAFSFDLVGDSDRADVLGALQLGAFFTGTGASDIEVASALVDDPRLVAGSRNGDPSDGSNFSALLGLKDAVLDPLAGRSVSQSYGDLIASVGLDVQTNVNTGEAHTQLLTSLENRRESISGVNQDEEMLHLVEYQHLYQAAGKYLQAISEMQQVLLDIL